MKIAILLIILAMMGICGTVTIPCEGNGKALALLGRVGFINIRYGTSCAAQKKMYARVQVSA